MIPLEIASVIALLSCAKFGECGWYRGRNAFRPDLWDDGLFIFGKSLVGRGHDPADQVNQLPELDGSAFVHVSLSSVAHISKCVGGVMTPPYNSLKLPFRRKK